MKLRVLCILILLTFCTLLLATDPWGEPEVLSGSMTVMAQVSINDAPAVAGDVLAAFVTVGGVPQLRGKGPIMVIDGISGCLLQVYTESTGEQINFKVWDESASVICVATQTLPSEVNGTIGSYPNNLYQITAYSSTQVLDPWGVPNVLTGSMTVMAQVLINNVPATANDILAAFVTVGGIEQLRGKANIQVISGVPGCLLQVFTESSGEIVTFKVWDYSEQQIVTSANTVATIVDGNIGSYPNDLYYINAGGTAQQVATPIFSVPEGLYTTAQNVAISCTTAGAQIRYTTNGTQPTEASPLYSTAITIPLNSVTTLIARAFLSGWLPSNIASATYTITGTVASPVFSPQGGTYTSAQTVTISCATPAAQIRYTTNGNEPTANSPVYNAPLTINSSVTLKAKAFLSNWDNSATTTAQYTITGTVSTPAFSPQGGTYTSAQTVTISCGTPGAQIRYTTNGNEPTTSSALYSAPLTVSVNSTIKAKGFLTNWDPSPTATVAYVITGTVAAPVFNPAAGEYEDPINVQINCSTPGALIYYTLDGTEPSQSSTVYTTAILLEEDTTVKARAYLTDWLPSQIVEAFYDFPSSNPEDPLSPVIPGIQSAYPNPFKEKLTVVLGVKGGYQDYQFKIYNVRGECVFSGSGLAKDTFELTWNGLAQNGSKLPSGLYLLRFSTKDVQNTRRVIMY